MKTAELTGTLLDYWVAKAEGLDGRITRAGCWLYKDGKSDHMFRPSTEWAQGGPIIERDQIMLQPPSKVHYNGGPNAGWKRYDHWRASVSSRTRTLPPQNETQEALGIHPIGRGDGETALTAAMRAKVASHYGEDVPDDRPTAQGAGDLAKSKGQV